MAKASITCEECGQTFRGHGNTQVAAEEDAMFKLQNHACSGSNSEVSKTEGEQ